MSRLEQKLEELGYKKSDIFWEKDDIHIYLYSNKTLIEDYCYVHCSKWIQSRNDIQELKDSIDYYHEQLMIMEKDLEVLRNVESER